MQNEQVQDRMISVVVATYNQEDTIARTLDGILTQQCYLPIEIIIGDDHSTDGTSSICHEFELKFSEIPSDNPPKFQIRHLYREKNLGVVDNYFDCLLQARGMYIADCAGDDEWCDPLKLEKELRILEENPDVVLVHTNYQVRDAVTGRISPAPPYPHTEGDTAIACLTQKERPVVHLCTSLYRRSTFMECYNEHRYYFTGRRFWCEDLQLTVLLSTKGRFEYLDDITLNYQVGNSSISNNTNYEKIWTFTAGVAELKYRLGEDLALKYNPRFTREMQFNIYALLMHSFRLHRRDLMERTVEMQREWGVKDNLRIISLRAITSCDTLWRLALGIRNTVVNMKS